jgi:acyl-CoA oxidase
VPTSFSAQELRDPATAILLLELRAALVVQEHAQSSGDVDASVNQRASKAITEAFIAAQVGQMINGLSALQDKDREVVTKVFLLVCCFDTL